MKRRDLLLGVSTAALTVAWARAAGAVGIIKSPVAPPRTLDAGDHLDRMWRDAYRRKIDPEAFMQRIFKQATGVLRRLNRDEIDEDTAAAQMLALHADAIRHPPAPREIQPLAASEIGVEEVMALLRRAIAGEASIIVSAPWRDVEHTYGDFSIGEWEFIGFRRARGINYIYEARAPGGRRGTHESWDAREGNPIFLLSNDEQDALDDLMEASEPQESSDQIHQSGS